MEKAVTAAAPPRSSPSTLNPLAEPFQSARGAAAAAAATTLTTAAAAADDDDARDKSLAKFAEDVVQILIDMKAPGCEWLGLTEEAA